MCVFVCLSVCLPACAYVTVFVAQNGSCGTSVVIKLFGQGTEGYIDRDKEAAVCALKKMEVAVVCPS